jgi:rod shape-determining protein MreB and related proteins
MFKDIKKFIPAYKVLDYFSNDLAMDLGTANTLVYAKDKGIVLNEPSVVAVKASTKKVLAAGHAAKEMLGKTPESIIASRPLRDGVIANFELAESMLRYFIRAVHNNKRTLVKPRMVIGVPSGITQVERRAVEESARQAGAREVYTIMEPMAAAIGAGLPVQDPSGCMIVDIGGGTTEVAVTTLKDLVFCRSVRVGGDAMDEAIVHYIKRQYNLLIGERTAEYIKITIGTVMTDEKDAQSIEVKGRDLITGVPKTVKLRSKEIEEALQEPVNKIIEVVRIALESTPPELSSDLVDTGIVIAGGGALLRGMDKLLHKETGLPVRIANDPLLSVVHGAGRVLQELDFFKDALM